MEVVENSIAIQMKACFDKAMLDKGAKQRKARGTIQEGFYGQDLNKNGIRQIKRKIY